jgi:3-deoxy-D-manno-octulosonic-acid transferase
LRLFDHFYVQDIRSQQLLAKIGITQVTLSGDTRYDRMLAVRAANQENAVIEAFKTNEPVIILGSSWPVDENLFAPILMELASTFKVIIAPHDISEAHIGHIRSIAGDSVQRYTAFNDPAARILILDTIGQLTSAYRYADLAYVGGGFTGKLHNILEPGAFGIPVIIGPKHERFPEAQLFIDRGVAVSVNESSGLKAAIAALWERKAAISLELERIFEENRGAAEVAVKGL